MVDIFLVKDPTYHGCFFAYPAYDEALAFMAEADTSYPPIEEVSEETLKKWLRGKGKRGFYVYQYTVEDDETFEKFIGSKNYITPKDIEKSFNEYTLKKWVELTHKEEIEKEMERRKTKKSKKNSK